MKKLHGSLGLALLILGLIVANLFVFGGRGGEHGTVVSPPPKRAQTVLQEPTLLAPELVVADHRLLLAAGDAGQVADTPRWGGIAGVVLGAGNHGPLSGASVRLTTLEGVGTTTDEQGAFRLSKLDPARRDVFVSAPGWVPALVEDVRIVTGELTRFQVTLERAQGAFVEVYSREGDAPDVPVSAAVVRLFPGGASAWVFLDSTELANSGISARTGADGRARIDEVRPGSYYALVSAPDHPVWRGDVLFVEADGVVRIDLHSGATIEGRVRSSAGRPGAGHVLIGPVERVTHPAFYYGAESVPLDERGEFRFTGVPDGEHHLVALLFDGEVALSEVALSVTAGETVEVELSASGTGTIRGRVTDQAGTPLAGARVKLATNALLHPRVKTVPGLRGTLFEQLKRSTVTDVEGRFVLEGVPTAAGRVEVSAELDGHAKATTALDIRPGQDLTWNPTLAARDSVVAGRVRAPFSGDLGGITIIAKLEGGENGGAASTATTKPDGSFELAVPSSGTVSVMASARDFTPPCRIEPRKIDGVPSGSRNVEFVLEPESLLRVRAVDEEGSALASLELSLFDDVEQRFQFSRVEHSSEGHYQVPVDPERHLFATLCSAGFEPAEIWDLAHKLDEVLVVEMTRSGEDVRIRVLDPDGEPIAGAGVSLAWFGERGAYPTHSALVPSVRTDAAGEGVLQAVPLRAPRDFLVAPGLADAPPLVHLDASELRGSGEPFVLQIPRCPLVQIELTGPDDQPAQGGCLIVSEEGIPITTRAFANLNKLESRAAVDPTRPVDGELLLRLEPGRYTLHHQGREALAGDVRIFDFTVREDGPNSFAFQVAR